MNCFLKTFYFRLQKKLEERRKLREVEEKEVLEKNNNFYIKILIVHF